MNSASTTPAAKAEFDGQRFLLTGATGSIGRATALKLTNAGAHVILNGRDQEKLEKVAATLPANRYNISIFDLDQTDEIPVWIRNLTEKYGPLSGLAHMAGLQVTTALKTVSTSLIQKLMHINVTSSLMLGKGFRQRGCHVENASIVFMGSTASRIGGAGNVPYAATKGAVIAATKAMAHEFLRDSIRVNCVVSGLVDSDMSERARKVTPPESWKVVLSGYPLGIGRPMDVADAITFLLSDNSRWITGTELLLDGGLSII